MFAKISIKLFTSSLYIFLAKLKKWRQQKRLLQSDRIGDRGEEIDRERNEGGEEQCQMTVKESKSRQCRHLYFCGLSKHTNPFIHSSFKLLVSVSYVYNAIFQHRHIRTTFSRSVIISSPLDMLFERFCECLQFAQTHASFTRQRLSWLQTLTQTHSLRVAR